MKYFFVPEKFVFQSDLHSGVRKMLEKERELDVNEKMLI